MAKKYTKKFKEKALSWLKYLNENGKIELSGEIITNVRDLVKFLKISSYTLYSWKPYSFKINCPFCKGTSVSDVVDSIEGVDGQWECSNGHQFLVKYLGKMVIK